jgi:PHD/YefM family antitoxin component YafN of YafNO toxin-antitoxin module
MQKRLPMPQAQEELASLPERLAEEPGAVAVTDDGEPVLAILSWDFYESLVETLEVLADEDLMAELRQSLQEAARGETIPWEKVKAELDL